MKLKKVSPELKLTPFELLAWSNATKKGFAEVATHRKCSEAQVIAAYYRASRKVHRYMMHGVAK